MHLSCFLDLHLSSVEPLHYVTNKVSWTAQHGTAAITSPQTMWQSDCNYNVVNKPITTGQSHFILVYNSFFFCSYLHVLMKSFFLCK